MPNYPLHVQDPAVRGSARIVDGRLVLAFDRVPNDPACRGTSSTYEISPDLTTLIGVDVPGCSYQRFKAHGPPDLASGNRAENSHAKVRFAARPDRRRHRHRRRGVRLTSRGRELPSGLSQGPSTAAAPATQVPSAEPSALASSGPQVYDNTQMGDSFDLPMTLTLPAGWLLLTAPQYAAPRTIGFVKGSWDDDSRWWGGGFLLIDDG